MADGRCLSVVRDLIPAEGLVKFAPDARHLLIAAADGSLQLYRLPAPKPFIRMDRSTEVALYDHRRSPASWEHVEAEFFSDGPAESAFHDLEAVNTGNGSRDAKGPDVFRDASASAGEYIGDTHAGEWLSFRVIPLKPHTSHRRLTARVRGTPGASFHLEIRGQDISGPISIPPTGRRDQWSEVTAEHLIEMPPSGCQDLRLVFDTAAGEVLELDWFGLPPRLTEPKNPPPRAKSRLRAP
jgi:hypothetical protein